MISEVSLPHVARVLAVDASEDAPLIAVADARWLLLLSALPPHRQLVRLPLSRLSSALALSPGGGRLAVGDETGRVVVLALQKEGLAMRADVLSEHRHGGAQPVRSLCWAGEHKLFSGCAAGLVLEQSLGAAPSPLPGWVPRWGGVSEVCRSLETPVQLCATESEVAGPCDLLLAACACLRLLLFHFPHSGATPRSCDLTAGLPLPRGRAHADFSYSCCFSAARGASSILVLRSTRAAVSVLYCTLSGACLQEFALLECPPAPLSCSQSPSPPDLDAQGLLITSVRRLTRRSGSMLVALAGGALVLLDLRAMALQRLSLPLRLALALPTQDAVLLLDAHGDKLRWLRFRGPVSLPLASEDGEDCAARLIQRALGRRLTRRQGQTRPSRPARPADCSLASALQSLGRPACTFELRVQGGGLGLSLEVRDLCLKVRGFSRLADGARGAPETGGVCVGDRLVAIAGARLAELGIEAAVGALRSLECARRDEETTLSFEYAEEAAPPSLSSPSALFDVFAQQEEERDDGDRSEEEGGAPPVVGAEVVRTQLSSRALYSQDPDSLGTELLLIRRAQTAYCERRVASPERAAGGGAAVDLEAPPASGVGGAAWLGCVDSSLGEELGAADSLLRGGGGAGVDALHALASRVLGTQTRDGPLAAALRTALDAWRAGGSLVGDRATVRDLVSLHWLMHAGWALVSLGSDEGVVRGIAGLGVKVGVSRQGSCAVQWSDSVSAKVISEVPSAELLHLDLLCHVCALLGWELSLGALRIAAERRVE